MRVAATVNTPKEVKTLMHVNRMTVTVRGSLSLSASGVHVQAARDRAGTRVPFPVSDENAAGEGSPVDAGLHW